MVKQAAVILLLQLHGGLPYGLNLIYKTVSGYLSNVSTCPIILAAGHFSFSRFTSSIPVFSGTEINRPPEVWGSNIKSDNESGTEGPILTSLSKYSLFCKLLPVPVPWRLHRQLRPGRGGPWNQLQYSDYCRPPSHMHVLTGRNRYIRAGVDIGEMLHGLCSIPVQHFHGREKLPLLWDG